MSNTGKHITYIANICGTEQDPQNIRENIRKLKECGVIVTQSNYESIRLAGAIINKLEKGAQNG
jgi:predicted transcriptional regulator